MCLDEHHLRHKISVAEKLSFGPDRSLSEVLRVKDDANLSHNVLAVYYLKAIAKINGLGLKKGTEVAGARLHLCRAPGDG